MLAQHERPTTPIQATSAPVSTSTSGPAPQAGHCQGRVDTKHPRRQVENDEYAAFVRRILRAYARRIGEGDVDALILMTGLAGEIDTAVAEAVRGLRACGYSWAEISSRLGITRQAAQQRWGTMLNLSVRSGK